MKLTSLPSKILLIVAVLSTLALNGDEQDFRFNLSSDEIFVPGEPGISVNVSGNRIGRTTVYFRAFRIDDPVDFFLAQKDPHSPTLLALEPPNTFDMLQVGFEKVKRDARYAARDVMPADARRAIRDVADLNSTRAEKRQQAREPRSDSVRVGEPYRPGPRTDIPKGAERYEIVADWRHTLSAGERELGWHYETIGVPIKDKGVYLIEARARGKRAITVLVISRYGMVIKQSGDRALSYVADRVSGKKIDDVELTFARGGKKFTSKSTDGDGLAEVRVPPVEKVADDDDENVDWFWEWRRRQVLVVGEKDGNFIISDPYYYDGYGSGTYKVYTHTDRPVYRPSQEVFYRGVVRKVRENGTYETISNTPVFIEITDARDEVVRRDTLRLDEMGTFDAVVTLDSEASLGTWSIRTRIDDEDYWFNFAVEEYKKPEYKVEVNTSRGHYTRGDVIEATVEADYFFGSPVTQAHVEYFVYRARYWRPWWRGTEWEFLYEQNDDFYTYRMEMVHSGEGTLDENGRMAITYRTGQTESRRQRDDGDDASDNDYVYRIQANVVDNSRRSISGAKSVEVTRGEFYVSSHTDRYVYKPGDKAKIDVEIATFDGDRPVATSFNVDVVRTWWDRIEKREADGSTSYEYNKKSEKIWSGNGTTGTDGKGQLLYPTERAGYFQIQISARDSRGTGITGSDYIYVSDNSYANWHREGGGDVQIIPDKDSYRPGETMNALLIMPAADIDALVTLEGSTIYQTHVERLTATSAVVHIPIKEEHAPVAYLNATALVNNEMYSESKRITVVPEGKLVRLEIEPDKQMYRPGEKGTVTVRAFDESGAPASNVDIALAMVDESIYSIRPDATPDIQRFFYGNRWNEVYTSTSLYFSFSGHSKPIETDDLYSEVGYGRRGLERYAQQGDARFVNVAFGDIKGEMFVQPNIRKKFKDMMFWTPSARTGSDGRARLEVEFPDNLTTWRITARAVTANTAVGQAISHVVARKDLMLRVETPRYMISGDELLVATTVHNYLSSGKQARLEFSGENLVIDSAQRTVRVAANGEQRVDWHIKAPESGSARLLVKALTDEESDAVELIVPVHPNGLMLSKAQMADLDKPTETRTVELELPAGGDLKASHLNLTLSPSLASSMLGSLDELIGYPYGCVEQTMSRFLPTVVVAQTLRELDVPFDPARRAEIPKMVERGFAKLYGMQNDGGSWGWWGNDSGDPFMTAYVVYGMTVARRAGYEPRERSYNNAIEWIDKRLKADRSKAENALDPTTEAYMLYVMSQVKKNAPDRFLSDRISSLSGNDTLNNYAVALLALANLNQGNRRGATILVERLQERVVSNPSLAWWEGRPNRYFWQDDAVETTAHAVHAMLAVGGESETTRKAIRWLLSQKHGDAWGNTRQTAMVIYSLIDYVKSSAELEPSFDLSVKVNGREVYAGRVTGKDVFAPAREIRVESGDLRAGTNTVTFEKRGTGRLYSTSRLVYWASGDAMQASSGGFTVKRQYYVLDKKKQGDVYVYTKSPFNGTVKTGQEIFVKVTVTPQSYYEYFMLEDPLPAGCEVVENTSGYTIPGEPEYDEAMRRERGWYGWQWWYSHRERRDEKMAFFSRAVQPKPLEFSYVLRAQIPGSYNVIPASASLMYYPEVRGTSGPASLRITP